jgi:hypothetical protein
MKNVSKKSVKKSTTKAKGAVAKPAAKPKAPSKDKPLSCLGAAEVVLKGNAGQPMRCADIIAVMVGKGLWSTKAPTPAATLYSAILREIQRKGPASRFAKADRGLFALNG